MGEERKKSSEELEYKVSKDYKVFYTFIFKKFPIILLFILVALLFYFFVIKPSEGKKYLVEDRTVAEGPIKKNYDTLY